MTTTILFSAFAPFSTLSLAVPSEAPISTLLPCLEDKYANLPTDSLRLASHSGLLDDTAPVSSLDPTQSSFISLRLTTRLLGGKGGFGSQLRAAGGRMSSQKTSNNDSCRDLNGRRLSTIKEAKKLAEYLESEPERQAAKADAQKAKLQALERKLGIDPKTGAPAPLAGTKHKFDDNEYLEESRELVDSVRSAVSAAMLKKRKKAKTSHAKDESAADVSKPADALKSKANARPAAEVAAGPVSPIATAPIEAIGA